MPHCVDQLHEKILCVVFGFLEPATRLRIKLGPHRFHRQSQPRVGYHQVVEGGLLHGFRKEVESWELASGGNQQVVGGEFVVWAHSLSCVSPPTKMEQFGSGGES